MAGVPSWANDQTICDHLNSIVEECRAQCPMASNRQLSAGNALDAPFPDETASAASGSNALDAPLVDEAASVPSGSTGVEYFLPAVGGAINTSLEICIWARNLPFFIVPVVFALLNLGVENFEKSVENFEIFNQYHCFVLAITFSTTMAFKWMALRVWMPVKMKVLGCCKILGFEVRFSFYFLYSFFIGALSSVHLVLVGHFIMEATMTALQDRSKWDGVLIIHGNLSWPSGLFALWILHAAPLVLYGLLTFPSNEATIPNFCCTNEVILKDGSRVLATPLCPITTSIPQSIRFVSRWNTRLLSNISHALVFVAGALVAGFQCGTDALPEYLAVVFETLAKTPKASVQSILKYFYAYILVTTLYIPLDYFVNEARVKSVKIGGASWVMQAGLVIGIGLLFLNISQTLRATFKLGLVSLDNYHNFNEAGHPGNANRPVEQQIFTDKNEKVAIVMIFAGGFVASICQVASAFYHCKLIFFLFC